MTPDFWRSKRVFLTGHTGFKGSWLALWLQSLGADVTGYALQPPTDPSLFDTARVGEGMKSVIADIRDMPALQHALLDARPEIVIHMAAQPLVRLSYQNPVETYATNVMGTVHLLEAVRQTPGVKAVVNITTDKCYENREWVWGYRENEPMGGYDPYSNSKGCAELVSAAFRSSFFNSSAYAQHGVAIATVRAGNVIGGGDWAQDRLIPDILAAFEVSQPARIRNPHAIRPGSMCWSPCAAT
jgi:CDP-glucose 4,6-dehydratase